VRTVGKPPGGGPSCLNPFDRFSYGLKPVPAGPALRGSAGLRGSPDILRFAPACGREAPPLGTRSPLASRDNIFWLKRTYRSFKSQLSNLVNFLS